MSPFDRPKTLLSITKSIIYKHIILFAENTESISVREQMMDYLKSIYPREILDLMLNELLNKNLMNLVKFRIFDMFFDRYTCMLMVPNFDEHFLNRVLKIIKERSEKLIYVNFCQISTTYQKFYSIFQIPNHKELQFVKCKLTIALLTSIKVVTSKKKRTNGFVSIVKEFEGNLTLERAKLYPDLKKITLKNCRDGSLECLKLLCEFEHLSLRHFTFNDLNQVMTKEFCERLLSLTLLNDVSKKLTDLPTFLCKFVNLKEFHFDKVYFFIPEEKLHIRFKFISIEVLRIRMQFTDPNSIKTLLKWMPNLKELKLEGWNHVSHHQINDLVNDGFWNNMTKLEIFRASNLTIETVWMLIQNCPNLEHIHYIMSWKVTKNENEEIKIRIRENNFRCCLNCDTSLTD